MRKSFFVYIVSNHKNGTIYIGVTSNLTKRIWEHKEGNIEGFSKRYGLKKLIYYEFFEDAENAIHREKRLKKYTRSAKIKLIEKNNPEWKDLYDSLF